MSQEDKIFDPSYSDETVPLIKYDISNYGADFDVISLVQRLRQNDIIVPKFQRLYVWNHRMASQFIESLLLGLPVPGIFLARDLDTNLLLVIDGQQRLKSLQYFYEGIFQSGRDATPKEFALIGVQPQFMGLTYSSLHTTERRALDTSVIHATIVKPNSPEDYTSIIHIFERINTRGLTLTVQEMRNAVYIGPFIDLTLKLNENDAWRSVFGELHPRRRDQELIIRFLALYFARNNYIQPMSEFLNRFVAHHREASQAFLRECDQIFSDVIGIAYESLGVTAFRINKSFNVPVFDSVMVGIAERIRGSSTINPQNIRQAYEHLLSQPNYREAISPALSNKTVIPRLTLATTEFAAA